MKEKAVFDGGCRCCTKSGLITNIRHMLDYGYEPIENNEVCAAAAKWLIVQSPPALPCMCVCVCVYVSGIEKKFACCCSYVMNVNKTVHCALIEGDDFCSQQRAAPSLREQKNEKEVNEKFFGFRAAMLQCCWKNPPFYFATSVPLRKLATFWSAHLMFTMTVIRKKRFRYPRSQFSKNCVVDFRL